MNPIIKFEIDPARIIQLSVGGKGVRAGGVRVKATVYIVEEPDIPGGLQRITMVTVPLNEKIGIAVVREDETLEEMKVGIIG